MPPDADQGVSPTTIWRGNPAFAWTDLADNIEDHIIVRELHLMRLPVWELVQPDALNSGGWQSRAVA